MGEVTAAVVAGALSPAEGLDVMTVVTDTRGVETVYRFLGAIEGPAGTNGLPFAAYIARLTRASMLETLSQDYVRSARAKGSEIA